MNPPIPLSLAELRQLTRAVGELSTLTSFAHLQQAVFVSLEQMVPGSILGNDNLDLESKEYGLVLNTAEFGSPALLTRFAELTFAGHHPYLEYVKAGGTELAMRQIDLMPEAEYRRGLMHNELYALYGVPYGMFSMWKAPTPTAYLNFAAVRDREFTDKEQALTRVYMEEVRRVAERLWNQSATVERSFTENGRTLGLTPREQEIMLWVFHGKSDKQISQVAGVSLRTVNTHLTGIYLKLGVHSRGAAVQRMLLGLEQAIRE